MKRSAPSPNAFVHDVFDGGHQWHGELAYPFLAAMARLTHATPFFATMMSW